jgi:hypothetical protein
VNPVEWVNESDVFSVRHVAQLGQLQLTAYSVLGGSNAEREPFGWTVSDRDGDVEIDSARTLAEAKRDAELAALRHVVDPAMLLPFDGARVVCQNRIELSSVDRCTCPENGQAADPACPIDGEIVRLVLSRSLTAALRDEHDWPICVLGENETSVEFEISNDSGAPLSDTLDAIRHCAQLSGVVATPIIVLHGNRHAVFTS